MEAVLLTKCQGPGWPSGPLPLDICKSRRSAPWQPANAPRGLQWCSAEVELALLRASAWASRSCGNGWPIATRKLRMPLIPWPSPEEGSGKRFALQLGACWCHDISGTEIRQNNQIPRGVPEWHGFSASCSWAASPRAWAVSSYSGDQASQTVQ